MNYYKTLEGLKSEVENNPNLQIEQSELRDGFDEKAIVSLVKRFGIQPSNDLVFFYKEVLNFRLTWRLKENNNISHDTTWPTLPMGIINIIAIDEFIGYDEFNKVQLDNDQVLYYFDYYNNDSQEGVCIMAKNGKIQDHLFLYGLEIGLVETNLTIPQYIKLLVTNRGFALWQRSIINPQDQSATQMKYYLPQLFQGHK